MFAVLKALEPIYYNKGAYIYKELDEFGEINFIQKGSVAIGFEINKKEVLPLLFKNRCCIGGFGVTFQMRSQFLYKAATYCTGFFIRREQWHDIMVSNDDDIIKTLKQNILIEFIWKIRSKLNIQKKKELQKYKTRSDYQSTLIVDGKDRN
jgi:hypothetical protein